MKGLADIGDFANETNSQQFQIKQLMNKMWTACPVTVVAVEAPHFVDVKPLIQQRDGENNAIPSAVLYHVPYSRIQGGKNALIIDPKPGDIGWCVFCQRDISVLKQTKAPKEVQVGSFRSYDPSDAIYLGGILNAVPERFVEVKDDAITIEGKAAPVTLHTSSKIILDAPLVEVTGILKQTGTSASGSSSFLGGFTNTGGQIKSNGVTLETHVHTGVETGSGNTGGPQG